jgi:hypothetical protein
MAFEQGQTTLLLAPDGKRIAGGDVAIHDAQAFAESVDAFLHGDGKLAARAEATKDDLVEQALVDLASGDPAEQEAATKLLFDNFAKYRSNIIAARRAAAAKPGPRVSEERLRTIVAAWAEAQSEKVENGTALQPYGATWSQDESLGNYSCPPCGMGHVPKTSRGFLDLLTRADRTSR